MRCLVTARRTHSHGNDTRTIARQAPLITIEELLEAVFSVGFAPRLYSEYLRPCGGGFKYPPASRRKGQKGNPVPGGITRPPCSWGIKMWGPGCPGWGSLGYEAVKYGHASPGTQTQEWLPRWGLAAIVNGRPVLSSERALHINKPATVLTVIKIWSKAPSGCLTPKQTGRVTVSRNITLTLAECVQLWDIRRAVTTWARKMTNLICRIRYQATIIGD
jgi:hypothetical protein